MQNDYRLAELKPRQRVMLDYADKLTRTPWEMTEDDLKPLREAGWDDRAILDINQTTAYYAYGLNNPSRFTDPSGHCAIDDDPDECFVPGKGTIPKLDTGDDQEGDCEGLACINEDDLPEPDTITENEPDWEKIAEGVAIIVVVDLLVVAPVVVGLTAFAPELEVAMILTEAWSWPLVATVVAVNVYAWDLIVAGANGD